MFTPKIFIFFLFFAFTKEICAQKTVSPLLHTIPIVQENGYIFTDILVDSCILKAMIDIGDPDILSISTTSLKKHKIKITQSNSSKRYASNESFKLNHGYIRS